MKTLRLHADAVGRHSNASQAFANPRLQLEDQPRPEPRANELLLRVHYCGLCGSDFHLAEERAGKLTYPGLASLPVTLGHEFSGEVIALGEGSSDFVRKNFRVGDLVTAEEMHWCGECGTCRAGHVNHCENLEELGFTRDGAHAEFVAVPAKFCWSLAKLAQSRGRDQALRLGALVEPYAVSFRALFQGAHRGTWLPGNRVLVIGCGPIGLAAADLALAAGASEVCAVEILPERRTFGGSFGITQVVAPENATSLEGTFDWIIDAAGTSQLATSLAEKHLAVGGTLCLLARTDEPLPIFPESLITKNARAVGSQGHSGESTFGRVIELMASGKLQAEKLVHEVVTLPRAWERLTRQERSAGKILVRPSGSGEC